MRLLERMPRHSDRVRLAGALVVVFGLLAAIWAYWSASQETDGLLSQGYAIVGGKIYASEQAKAERELQLERLGGKAAVWAVEFNEWLAAQFQGRRLALTLLVLSVIFALGCFHVAGLMDETSESDMS